MKRLVLVFMALAFVASLLPPSNAVAQVPNAKGISGSITTSGASDHGYIVSLRQLTDRGRAVKARFLSNFTVSDSCRVVIVNTTVDEKFKTPAQSSITNDPSYGLTATYYAEKWIPLTAETKYNFVLDSDYLIIYVYGDARSVVFSGVVEYYE